MSEQDVSGSACALTIDDIDSAINHEPRIADLRLAETLGFAQPVNIRKLIRQHQEALGRFGEVISAAEKTSEKGGRPGKGYWLNKRQALYLCTKSETERATEATIAMVEVFDAYTAGRLLPPPAAPDEPPFCAGCAARTWWCEAPVGPKPGLPMATADGEGRPLELHELTVIGAMRGMLAWKVEQYVQARSEAAAAAVRAALGLPDPAPPLRPVRQGRRP